MRWSLLALLFTACTGNLDSTDGSDPAQPGADTMAADPSTGSPAPAPGDPPGTPPAPSANGPMVSADLIESTGDVLNPERGFYAGYDLLQPGTAAGLRARGFTLAIAEVHLDAYRTSAIPAALLAQLDTGFAAARAAGIKVVLRFMYNNSFAADASKAQILAHLVQLRPLLRSNVDVIAVMQAGFIGAWGEWHSSTNGLENDADRTAILDAILDALPPQRNVDVRRPTFKEAAFPGGPLSADEAYSETRRARVGHHNDCFLASATDYGTYPTPIAPWENYVGTDGLYTANGGETCGVYAPRSDCSAAVSIMAAGHWSYLNSEYNQTVLDRWSTQGCRAEVARRLGYRFTLTRVAHTGAIAPGGALDLEVDVANHGFASPYNRRPVEVVLSKGTWRRTVRLADIDARRWAAGATTHLAVRLRIPASAEPGTYSLALRLPDDETSLAADPRYAIALANDGVFDGATGANVLARDLTIDAAAPGPRDAAAADFVQLP